MLRETTDLSEGDLSEIGSTKPDSPTNDSTAEERPLEAPKRPVYEGDWAKASGKERMAHARRVKAWSDAFEPKADETPSREPIGSTKPSTAQDADAADSIASLKAIRDDPKASRSEKIRASEAILKASSGSASSGSDEVELWLARRAALEAVPEADRADLLREALRPGGP